ADVLVMYGGKGGKQMELIMRRLAAALPHSATKEFARLDHLGIMKKAPREMAQAVADFFLER
ncbi:MAG TPA: alpha/beta hydrolase, partial [Ktedonobacterales bacterium]|nr:alpha/beta hydrolase [Ktedonobacterales bacterium]